ncbi:MAG: TRAP transporter large permease subunit, partial [Proteobacteria bacterium]|nr:TRAP transporter large permease subunit [Pseudomonadota bacterium]
VFVNLMVFVLAFFLDFFELSFIVVPLLGPIADKMGIDLVWFGVLLAVNMQTSFMHPPFGFALFFLRSVAPEKPYVDHVTGKTIAPVTTMQIYKGAIPFLALQLAMVAILIAFPGLVTSQLDKKVDVDMNAVGSQMLENLNKEGADFGEPAAEGSEQHKDDATAPPTIPAEPTPPSSEADDPVKALQESAGKH